MNLQEYLGQKLNLIKKEEPMNESLRSIEIYKAINDLQSILEEKGISTYLSLKKYNIGTTSYVGRTLTNANGGGVIILWKTGDTINVDSLIMFENIVGAHKTWCHMECATAQIFMNIAGKTLQEACDIAISILDGSTPMTVEGLANYNLNASGEVDSVEDLEKKKNTMYSKIKYANKMRYPNDEGLQQEYEDIKAKIESAKNCIDTKVIVCQSIDLDIENWEKWFERQLTEIGEKRFGRILPNIINDLQGENSVCILTGCIQKTAEILGGLKNAGITYNLFNGIANDANLYRNLADNRQAGQVLIYNDCDSILGQLAGVNINGKKVSWEKSGKILSRSPREGDNFFNTTTKDGITTYEYPKEFEYNGNRLILTNMGIDDIHPSYKQGASWYDGAIGLNSRLDIIIDAAMDVRTDMYPEEFKIYVIDIMKKMIESGESVDISMISFIYAVDEYYCTIPGDIAEVRAKEILTAN